MQHYEYAGIMLASILTAVWLGRRNQQNLGLTTAQKWGIRYGAFVGSLIGAKLPFLVTNPQGLLNRRGAGKIHPECEGKNRRFIRSASLYRNCDRAMVVLCGRLLLWESDTTSLGSELW